MKDKLAELHKLRLADDMYEETKEIALRLLEETQQYKNLHAIKEKQLKCRDEMDTLADEIRKDVLANFDAENISPDVEPNKKPYDGIQIKEFQTIEVTDEEEAIKWSIDSGQFALVSLVTSKFNKIAKVLDLPFVTKGTEYLAQIASDLSMYEEKDE
jgi:hypothetical protein